MADIARQIVRTSLNLTDRDVLQVHAWRHTTDLAADIAREGAKVGADVLVSYFDDRMWLAHFVEADPKFLEKRSPTGAALGETVTAEVELGGPEDPKVFDRTKPERMDRMMAAFKEIEDRKRERKVRGAFVALGQVTPQRARKYGVSYPKWKRIVNAALRADLRKIAAKGGLVAKALGGASDVRLTGDGTDLTLDLSGREPVVRDGIVDANDIARGALHVSLPGGTTAVAPVETAGDGIVTFPSVPLWGKMMRDLRLTFDGGRLVDYAAARNGEAFAKFFEASKAPDKERIGSLAIGLNPKASFLGGFVDHLVSGAVTVGIGSNEDLGGQNKGFFEFDATIPKADLKAGGVPLVEGGILRV